MSAMSAVSVFIFSAFKHQKMPFALDNPNMVNPDNVGSFRIWILLGSKTKKKKRFAADNPNKENADNVCTFRI